MQTRCGPCEGGWQNARVAQTVCARLPGKMESVFLNKRGASRMMESGVSGLDGSREVCAVHSRPVGFLGSSCLRKMQCTPNAKPCQICFDLDVF